MIWRWPLLAVTAAALLLAACFGGGSSEPGVTVSTPSASPTPQAGTPEDALAIYARQKHQMEYAGDCQSAQQNRDEGKLCTVFKGDRGPMKAYLAGPTFSEFGAWVFLEQKAGGWEVTGEFPWNPQAADVPGVPWPLTVGAQVVVVGTGRCLNVRAGPGLGQPAVDCIPDGSTIKLAEGPQVVDGFQWWRLEDRAGWVAADWLRYPDAVQ